MYTTCPLSTRIVPHLLPIFDISMLTTLDIVDLYLPPLALNPCYGSFSGCKSWVLGPLGDRNDLKSGTFLSLFDHFSEMTPKCRISGFWSDLSL